jgi:hypothetical protein
LPVSLKGVKPGDFTMIWGYPGGTNRYESSFGVQLATDISNPTLVKLRDMRLKYMFEEMKKILLPNFSLLQTMQALPTTGNFLKEKQSNCLNTMYMDKRKSRRMPLLNGLQANQSIRIFLMI